jgi:large subunit ribosomal protein L10
MPKTKSQKIEEVKEISEKVKSSETVIVADFTGLDANGMNELRTELHDKGITFKAIKKRLLNLAFDNTGISLSPKKMEGQLGIALSNSDVAETARPIYEFHKKYKEKLKITGGYYMKREYDAEELLRIGALPNRDVLIGQIVGMFTSPIRSLLFVLSEKSKMVEDLK